MAERRRTLGGLPGLAGHLALAFAVVPRWLFTREKSQRRLSEQRFFGRALRAVGVAVRVTGTPRLMGGTLFVANHISFTDILALGREIDAVFVAKSDVRRWPVIGALAKRFGVIFVDRDRSHGAREQTERIAAHLRQRSDVILFPEGTTSEGNEVLPFRSALLDAAAAAQCVQPIAIRYSDGAQRAYIGEESLLANLIRLAPQRAIVELAFLPPLPVETLSDRKALARAAREAIVAALADMPMPGT